MIDKLSFNILTLALYLDKIKPGSVSEVWVDEEDLKKIRAAIELGVDVEDLTSSISRDIELLPHTERKEYLREMLSSLSFQFSDRKTSIAEYYQKCYGFRIERVSDWDLEQIELRIHEFELKLGKTRFEIHKKHLVGRSELLEKYKEILEQTRKKIPTYLTNIDHSNFSFEVVTDKPWVAFNSHLAPYTSKLSLNAASNLTDLDLIKFSQHEAWGGHHSELSLKDALLVENGRGEHGLVVVNSPQVFVSEGIAEGLFSIFGLYDQLDDEQRLLWWYTRKLLALHNLAAHYYFDDKKTKQEIISLLAKFDVGGVGIRVVVDFSTNEAFGRYSAVYYSASTFISSLYQQCSDKDEFLKYIFTQPCTPNMLIKKFSAQSIEE